MKRKDDGEILVNLFELQRLYSNGAGSSQNVD